MNHAEVVSGNFFLIWPTQRQYRGEIHISSCFGRLRLMLMYPHNSHLSHTATPHINTNFMINSTTLYYMHRKACGPHRYAAHHDKLHDKQHIIILFSQAIMWRSHQAVTLLIKSINVFHTRYIHTRSIPRCTTHHYWYKMRQYLN